MQSMSAVTVTAVGPGRGHSLSLVAAPTRTEVDEHALEAARPVPVGSFPSRPLAQLACSYLQEHGIDAAVQADDGNGTQPEVGFVTGGARVVVAPTAVTAARDLLGEVGPSTAPRRVHPPLARWVAGAIAATMALLAVWTTVVLLLL